jgi:hypothetical protein
MQFHRFRADHLKPSWETTMTSIKNTFSTALLASTRIAGPMAAAFLLLASSGADAHGGGGGGGGRGNVNAGFQSHAQIGGNQSARQNDQVRSSSESARRAMSNFHLKAADHSDSDRANRRTVSKQNSTAVTATAASQSASSVPSASTHAASATVATTGGASNVAGTAGNPAFSVALATMSASPSAHFNNTNTIPPLAAPTAAPVATPQATSGDRVATAFTRFGEQAGLVTIAPSLIGGAAVTTVGATVYGLVTGGYPKAYSELKKYTKGFIGEAGDIISNIF